MNYLAHGFRHVADPWFLTGTALPDWMRVLGRRIRLGAEALPALPGAEANSIVRGVLRHQDDDRRFHGSLAFEDARREVTALLRSALDPAAGHRASFIAHLLVEMHLDAAIADANPGILDAYYAALASIDAAALEEEVRRVDPAAPAGLARLVAVFIRERFLGDYGDGPRLLNRLNLVLRRVRQPELPMSPMLSLFPAARRTVEARRAELLAASDEPEAPGAGNLTSPRRNDER